MKYYRVVHGYGKQDFYSIPETDVAKALRAQVNGTVFLCDEGSVSGNEIKSIKPDYNRAMGFNRDYVLNGEDYEQLGTKTIREHQNFLAETKREALAAGNVKQIGNGN